MPQSIPTLLVISSAVLWLTAAPVPAAAPPQQEAMAEVPAGLTSDLRSVPLLPAAAGRQVAYTLQWQRELSYFERRFEAGTQQGGPSIDPIETGSINDRD